MKQFLVLREMPKVFRLKIFFGGRAGANDARHYQEDDGDQISINFVHSKDVWYAHLRFYFVILETLLLLLYDGQFVTSR